MFIFPVQLTTSRIGNLTRLIHTLLYVMTIHTYIHTYIHVSVSLLQVSVSLLQEVSVSLLQMYVSFQCLAQSVLGGKRLLAE